MAAEKDFQRTLMSCRLTRSTYSKLFHGIPDSFNFGRDGKQLIFLSSGSLHSYQLEPSDRSIEKDISSSVHSVGNSICGNWKKLRTSGHSRELSRCGGLCTCIHLE